MFRRKNYSYDKDYSFSKAWVSWQYIESPRTLLRIWKNFLIFNLSFFSIPLLLKTLFYPWRKYHESYGRGFDPKRFFSSLTFNSISRLLGALVRTVLILVGLFLEILLMGLGIILLIGWIFLPIILIGILIFGIYLIFQ